MIWHILANLLIVIVLALILLQINIRLRKDEQRKLIQEKRKASMIEAEILGRTSKEERRNRDARMMRHDEKELLRIMEKSKQTDSNPLTMLLGIKAGYAKDNQIDTSVDIRLVPFIESWIPEKTDQVRLIMNLFNNAIESCLRIPDNRKIEVIVDDGDGGFVIRNSKPGDVHPLETNFQTSKQDSKNHGIGSRIIKEIVASYKGKISYADEGDYFAITVKKTGEKA